MAMIRLAASCASARIDTSMRTRVGSRLSSAWSNASSRSWRASAICFQAWPGPGSSMAPLKVLPMHCSMTTGASAPGPRAMRACRNGMALSSAGNQASSCRLPEAIISFS